MPAKVAVRRTHAEQSDAIREGTPASSVTVQVSSTLSTNGLPVNDSLIGAIFSLTPGAFVSAVFGKQVRFGRFPARALERLREAVRDPASLARRSRGIQKAFRVGGDGSWQEQLISADAIPARLRSFETVCLKHAEAGSAVLAETCAALANELGIARHFVYANVYVSPPGTGVAKHFDCTDALIVQLAGAKRWSVDESATVVWAEHNCVVGAQPAPAFSYLDPSGWAQSAATLERTLRAGDVVTIPRGVCHATAAEASTSTSITFTFAQPSRRQALEGLLRELLLQDERWRRPLVSDPSVSEQQELSELMQELAAVIASGPLSSALQAFTSPQPAASVREQKGMQA